jgi:signal peptidase I
VTDANPLLPQEPLDKQSDTVEIPPSQEGFAVPAEPQSPPESRPQPIGIFREYAESGLVTAIIFLFIVTFVVQAFKIPTGSMENNLLIGDHLMVNKFIFGQNGGVLESLLPARAIRRGDIFVFKYPEDPKLAYVKRVIGIPGDEIEIIGHTVYVNGKSLQEPYTHFLYPADNSRIGPQKVPENHYFAMGDNRDNSQDSRYWGYVPRELIMGKAFLIYWSYETDRDEYRRDSLPERASQILDVCLHFFTKTRWERTMLLAR